MLIGPDDGYQAETGCPVIQHFLFTHSHHLVVLASCQPLCLVLTHTHTHTHTQKDVLRLARDESRMTVLSCNVESKVS